DVAHRSKSPSRDEFEGKRNDFAAVALAANERFKLDRESDLELPYIALNWCEDPQPIRELHQSQAKGNEWIGPLVVARRSVTDDRVSPQCAALAQGNFGNRFAAAVRAETRPAQRSLAAFRASRTRQSHMIEIGQR